ncbi:MAG: hypothetical protein PHU06_05745 [Gallionella sp.]|nr:hypothetical protein [Gallionella sp.]MDD4958085.1 hypothetical protein [Gallionella sp.]
MSATVRVYRELGICVVIFGIIAWWLFGFIAFFSILLGLAIYIAPFFLEELPLLFQKSLQAMMPNWEGGVLHTDGGEYQIRYYLDEVGQAHFVAKDVCLSIGKPAPKQNTLANLSIFKSDKPFCFSENSIKTYLNSLSAQNRAAARLLVILQNQLLQQLERERDTALRYDATRS